MPVLGAVVTLSRSPEERTRCLEGLATLPHLTLGELAGDRLPVVLDTPDRVADRAAWKGLEKHPGVVHAELVFADFSDLHAPEAPCSAATS